MLQGLVCRRCERRIHILKLILDQGGEVTAKQLYDLLGRQKSEYTYLYRHLRKLQEAGVLTKVGQKYMIPSPLKGKIEEILLDPCLKFYFAGVGRALEVLKKLPFRVPYLMSAGHYWASKFRKVKRPEFASDIFIDSGAQQFYRKFKGLDYPYRVDEYLDFALSLSPNLIATLDLPLDILVPKGLSVSKGIKMTVEYGVDVVERAAKREVSGLIVPVLQGYNDPSQWLECYDLYKQHGISSNIWGVGSLCMTGSVNLVKHVIGVIREKVGDAMIHVFGLSLKILRKVYMLIDSLDSSAWVYIAKTDGSVFVWDPLRFRFMHMQARDGKRYDTLSLMAANIYAILSMIEDLRLRKTQLVQVKDFNP